MILNRRSSDRFFLQPHGVSYPRVFEKNVQDRILHQNVPNDIKLLCQLDQALMHPSIELIRAAVSLSFGIAASISSAVMFGSRALMLIAAIV